MHHLDDFKAILLILMALTQTAFLKKICDPNGALSFCSVVDLECPKRSEELYSHTICEEKKGQKCCRNTCDGPGSQCSKQSCASVGLQPSLKRCSKKGFICCRRAADFDSVLKQKPILPSGTMQGGSNLSAAGSGDYPSAALQNGAQQQPPLGNPDPNSAALPNPQNPQQTPQQTEQQQLSQTAGQAAPYDQAAGVNTPYPQQAENSLQQPAGLNLQEQQQQQQQQQQQLQQQQLQQQLNLQQEQQQGQQKKLTAKQKKEQQINMQNLQQMGQGQGQFGWGTQMTQNWFDELLKVAETLPSERGNEMNSQRFGAEHTVPVGNENAQHNQPINPSTAAVLPAQRLQQPQSATQEQASSQPSMSDVSSLRSPKQEKGNIWRPKKYRGLMPMLQNKKSISMKKLSKTR